MGGSDIYRTLDDNGLFSLIQHNDQMAFTELYNRYSPVLYLFILFYVKDEEQTRDTLQSLFLNLWEQRHRIAISSNVRNYLYTAAKNSVLNIIRSHKVRTGYQSMIHDESRQLIPSPEELYEREEMNRLVELAIDDLRHEKKQRIVELRRQGMSNKDVARELGIPENTVRTYYAQSIRAMRENLGKLFSIMATILLNL